MKSLLFIVLIVVLTQIRSSAQDALKKRTPIMVSHLSANNKAILRRKGAPKHSFISMVFCFKKKCRAYIGWRKKQRGKRFKGYKDGGKVPRSPLIKPQTAPVREDTLTTEPVLAQVVTEDVSPTKEQIFILDEVLFEINSTRLNTGFTFRLDSLVELLETHPHVKMSITGHTDNTGNELHNLKLSTNRAKAVARYLINSGIDQNRVSFQGLGSKKPIASNDTIEGRRKNRRVEILLSGE